MSSLGSSSKLGLLSISLSAWIEGSAQLRNALLLVLADLPSSTSSSVDSPSSDNWRANFIYWLTRSSRDLDHGEKAALAGLDLLSALAIFKLIQIKPLLPFLLTPISATVPVPASFNAQSLRGISWVKVAFTILFATLWEESNKVTILHWIRLWRRHRLAQRRLTLGRVVPKGAPAKLPMENDEEEEEIECLICSGIGSEENDPMAQSISSLASTTLESVNGNGSRNEQFFHRTESFGPLEEFCINAPHKHLAHRECFLQWVEAYRQQHQRIFLEPVTVVYEDPTEMERIGKRRATQQKAWIKSILQAAGFEHILSSLIYPPPPSQQQTLSRGQTSITVRPTPRAPSQSRSLLMIMNASSSSPSSSSSSSTPFAASNNNTLAALQTSSPSCPACRGPVSILFTQEPLHPQSRAGPSLASPQALAQRLARLRKFIKLFMRGWRREFLASVTGRSLLWRLVAQYSFLFVLVSMIRATRKGKRILV